MLKQMFCLSQNHVDGEHLLLKKKNVHYFVVEHSYIHRAHAVHFVLLGRGLEMSD